MNNNTSFYENKKSEEAEKNVRRTTTETKSGPNVFMTYDATKEVFASYPSITENIHPLFAQPTLPSTIKARPIVEVAGQSTPIEKSGNILNKSKSVNQNPDSRNAPNRTTTETKSGPNVFMTYDATKEIFAGYPNINENIHPLFAQPTLPSTIKARPIVEVAEQSTPINTKFSMSSR